MNREAMTWKEIREKTLEKITPSQKEKEDILGFAEKTIKKINKTLTRAEIDAVAELHGSVAHGTWISGQQDLDFFIVNQRYRSREQLKETLRALKQGLDWSFTEAYAEHPYLKTEVNGYNIDLVPCFRVEYGEELHSSTDRTPLHTRWLKDKLEARGDDVRLLKLFLMNLDIYGAEIKIGGFSGYLCELLVVYYKDFLNLMEEAAKWGRHEVLSFTGVSREFDDPLTFIDPVDPSRNVASALREENYSVFVAAARSFIKKPSHMFFEQDKQEVEPKEVLELLEDRPSDILFLVIEEGKADVPDVLWGQIHKSRQAIIHQLEKEGFTVLRDGAWSNEETRHIFVYELESASLHETVKHMGPPAHLESNVRQFIDKYKNNPRTITGPDLLKNRWYVLISREFTEVEKLMKELLLDGGRNIGVSKKLAVLILQHHRVILNMDIKDYLIEGFEDYLFYWLKGRPQWIE